MSLVNRFLACLILFSLPAFAASSVSGIGNFYKVDDHVYRGAQPTDQGLKYLAGIGVKTILDLRGAGRRSSEEERAVTALGMHYVNVPMSGFEPPTEAQISKALELLEDTASGPVFVHCRRGADRTGAVVAAYRIESSHWDNARALREAISEGMSFFQLPRQSYIMKFQPRAITAKTSVKPESPASMVKSAATAAAAVLTPATAP